MDMRLDHVVLWVADPVRSVEFYESVVGLTGVRVDDFRAGRTMFPSVRVNAETILDLMPLRAAPMLNAKAAERAPAAADATGHRVNHVCLAMSQTEFEALRQRLDARGIDTSMTMTNSFGAGGSAPLAFYFHDPDGNVLEARYYA